MGSCTHCLLESQRKEPDAARGVKRLTAEPGAEKLDLLPTPFWWLCRGVCHAGRTAAHLDPINTPISARSGGDIAHTIYAHNSINTITSEVRMTIGSDATEKNQYEYNQ